MVGLAEVGEDSYTNSLQSSLVAEGEGIAVDLVPKHRQEEALKEKKLSSATLRMSWLLLMVRRGASLSSPNFREKEALPIRLL